MLKKKISILGYSLIFLLIPAILYSETNFWRFSQDSISIITGDFHFQYPEAGSLIINKDFSIPIKVVYVKSPVPLTKSDFFIRPENQISVGKIPSKIADFDNAITDIEKKYKDSFQRDASALSGPVYSIDEIKSGDGRYYTVGLLLICLDNGNNLLFNSEISLLKDIEVLPAEWPNESINNHSDVPNITPSVSTQSIYGIPLGNQYVIITSPSFAESFGEFIEFKNILGISTALALTDSIYAKYSGVDKAEKIRNYLKDFRQSGGIYVMLGGDDEIIPPRYMLYYNANVPPSDKQDLMPSDLYYSELDGTYDLDGDGIWGEPTHDSPELDTDLKVGRIPVKTPSAAKRFISKLIAFYTSPGDGNYDYLMKALFFTADEMRDYPANGQHNAIAEVYPEQFLIDTFTTVEFPSGADPSPSNATGYQSIQKISEGFGIVNIITHGRADGFVVRSANYGGSPSSLVITSASVSTHGSTDDLIKNNHTSLYYSLACNGGGYDLDSINGISSDFSLVERLISIDSAGAIGMVANSRWGWVYSSYLLQKSFMKHLFTDAYGSPVDAMHLSWFDYPYFRDLIYGQNYFGDPSMKIYLKKPSPLVASIEKSGSFGYQVKTLMGQTPVSGVSVKLSCNGNISKQGSTDNNGIWSFSANLDYYSIYTVTAIKNGYTIAQTNYIPSIVADVDELDWIAPSEFALLQNYPNPFNPSTVIRYSLSSRADICLNIYNLLGQSISENCLYNQPAGWHEYIWNGKDKDGHDVPSGIYFYSLDGNGFHQTRKMLLIK